MLNPQFYKCMITTHYKGLEPSYSTSSRSDEASGRQHPKVTRGHVRLVSEAGRQVGRGSAVAVATSVGALAMPHRDDE